MADDPVFNIIAASGGRPPRPPDDSVLVKVPAGWYATAGGVKGLHVRLAGREMRQIGEMSAARLGRRVAHAEWVITADPFTVAEIGLTHDCDECRGGTGAAVAWLAQTPGGKIAAGRLWWA